MKTLNTLAEQLLLAVKMAESTDSLINELKGAERAHLKSLKSDAEIKAFWINIYNAFYQILIHEDGVDSKKIFGLKKIEITGRKFSLDQIEHGILRMGKNKFTAGLFQFPFQYLSLKSLRPKKLDYRIHFSLNCGVASCPPIAFYHVNQLDAQLNLATESYLSTSTRIDVVQKKVIVTRLFLWFYHDFARKNGIMTILNKHYGAIPLGFKIEYAPYNREKTLLNFTT